MGNFIATDRPETRDIREAGPHTEPKDMNARLERRARVLRRMMANRAGAFAILEKFYELLDVSLVEAYPAPTCKRGCGHCCYIGVGIGGHEAKYIEYKTGVKIQRYEQGECDQKEKRPCTFLNGNECSIYQYRPAVCRVFRSFSPVIHCQDNSPHLLLALYEPGRGGFDWANVIFQEVSLHIMRENVEMAVANDIRVFFGAAANTQRGNK